MKLLIAQSSLASRYFLPLGSIFFLSTLFSYVLNVSDQISDPYVLRKRIVKVY